MGERVCSDWSLNTKNILNNTKRKFARLTYYKFYTGFRILLTGNCHVQCRCFVHVWAMLKYHFHRWAGWNCPQVPILSGVYIPNFSLSACNIINELLDDLTTHSEFHILLPVCQNLASSFPLKKTSDIIYFISFKSFVTIIIMHTTQKPGSV